MSTSLGAPKAKGNRGANCEEHHSQSYNKLASDSHLPAPFRVEGEVAEEVAS
jgi:hypothetical protein